MTPSSETQGPRPKNKPCRRLPTCRALLPFLLLAAALPVGLAQSWMAHERRCVAYDLAGIDERMSLVRDELSEAHIAVEELRASVRADAIASELGLVPLEHAPVVLAEPPGQYVAEASEPPLAPEPAVLAASFTSMTALWPLGRIQGSQAE